MMTSDIPYMHGFSFWKTHRALRFRSRETGGYPSLFVYYNCVQQQLLKSNVQCAIMPLLITTKHQQHKQQRTQSKRLCYYAYYSNIF